MKYFLLIIGLFLLLIVQGELLILPQFGQVGSLLVVFVVISTALAFWTESLAVAIVAGLMLDFASSARDGIMLASMLGVWGLSYWFVKKFNSGPPSFLILVMAVGLSTLWFSFCFVIFTSLINGMHVDNVSIAWQFILGKKLIFDLFLNLIFIFPIYNFYRWVKRWS